MEIEQTRRNYSKIPNGPAWTKSLEEMQKKTVMRRLLKLVELNFDNNEQDKAFEDGGDMNKDSSVTDTTASVSDPFDSKQIEQRPLEDDLNQKMSEEEIKELWKETEADKKNKPPVSQ